MSAKKEKDLSAIERAKSFKDIPWCDDYERMISGMLYNAYVPELIEGRFRARKLTNKYNTYCPEDATAESLVSGREGILRDLLGSVGGGIYIEGPFSVDYGCNISIGERFYANYHLVILDCGLVTIGDRVMCGPFVSIFAATHETEVQSRRDNIDLAAPVTIGNDCWIGGHVSIIAGVTIGDGCTIGAGSVVTKDIPAWSVAVGSPARVVKKVTPIPPMKKEDEPDPREHATIPEV